MKKQYNILAVVIAVAVIIMGLAVMRQHQKAQDIADDSSVRVVVSQFGSTIQKVSLSTPNALAEIANAYAPYASSSLISYWQANRSFAPGKGLSSPWPDRIEINSVMKDRKNYVVEGNVIEVTSKEVIHGGIAAQFPVQLTLSKYGNSWLIVKYEAGPIQSFVNSTTTASKTPKK
jgi:hypothetical protein